MKKLLRREEGSGLVEMAFAMLVLLPILFGTIEFSLVFFAYNNVTDAARVAVRWAAVRGADSCTYTPRLTNCDATTDTITSYVRSLGYPGLTPANIGVTTTWSAATTSYTSSGAPTTTWTACASGCNSRGDQLQVKVSYNYPITIPFWKTATFAISSQSSMVITQ